MYINIIETWSSDWLLSLFFRLNSETNKSQKFWLKTTGWIIRTKKPGYLQRDTNKIEFWSLWLSDSMLKRQPPDKKQTRRDNPSFRCFFLICENWFRNRMTMFGRVFNLPEFSCNFILEHHEMEIRRCLWRSDIVFQGYI